MTKLQREKVTKRGRRRKESGTLGVTERCDEGAEEKKEGG